MAADFFPLSVEPSTIHFGGSFSQALMLSNKTDKIIFFGLKSTCQRNLDITPRGGALSPHNSISISVILKSNDDIITSEENKHRITIRAAFQPENPVVNSQGNVFDTVKNEDPVDFHVKLIFDMAAGSSTNPSVLSPSTCKPEETVFVPGTSEGSVCAVLAGKTSDDGRCDSVSSMSIHFQQKITHLRGQLRQAQECNKAADDELNIIENEIKTLHEEIAIKDEKLKIAHEELQSKDAIILILNEQMKAFKDKEEFKKDSSIITHKQQEYQVSAEGKESVDEDEIPPKRAKLDQKNDSEHQSE